MFWGLYIAETSCDIQGVVVGTKLPAERLIIHAPSPATRLLIYLPVVDQGWVNCK
jgi:hypothetical protein